MDIKNRIDQLKEKIDKAIDTQGEAAALVDVATDKLEKFKGRLDRIERQTPRRAPAAPEWRAVIDRDRGIVTSDDMPPAPRTGREKIGDPVVIDRRRGIVGREDDIE